MTKERHAPLLELHGMIENDLSILLSAITKNCLNDHEGLLKLCNEEVQICESPSE